MFGSLSLLFVPSYLATHVSRLDSLTVNILRQQNDGLQPVAQSV
jgi:hypothetical protein